MRFEIVNDLDVWELDVEQAWTELLGHLDALHIAGIELGGRLAREARTRRARELARRLYAEDPQRLF
jgi:hypothetical protein